MKETLLAVLASIFLTSHALAQSEFPSGLGNAGGAEAESARSAVRDARQGLADSRSAAEQAVRSLQTLAGCASRNDSACVKTETAALKEIMARATALDRPFAQRLSDAILKPSLYKELIKFDVKDAAAAWVDVRVRLWNALQEVNRQVPVGYFTQAMLAQENVSTVLDVAYGGAFTRRLLEAINAGSQFRLQIDLPQCQRVNGAVTNAPCLN